MFLYVAVDIKSSLRDTEQVLHFDKDEALPFKGLWKPAVLNTLCSQNSIYFTIFVLSNVKRLNFNFFVLNAVIQQRYIFFCFIIPKQLLYALNITIRICAHTKQL